MYGKKDRPEHLVSWSEVLFRMLAAENDGDARDSIERRMNR